jgi:hypothetical protein
MTGPVASAAVAVPSARWGPRGFVRVRSWPSLTIWQGACVECGAPFEVTTPSLKDCDFEIITCSAHRNVIRMEVSR